MAQIIEFTAAKSDATKAAGLLAAPRKAIEQCCLAPQNSDYVAWLREYHRWTESGCSAQKNRGEIEWGLEGDGNGPVRAAPQPSASDDTTRRRG